MLKTLLLNAGDDAFLPRLTLRFPNNIHYIKVLQNVSLHNWLDSMRKRVMPPLINSSSNFPWHIETICDSRKLHLCLQEDNMVSCDVTQEVNSTTAGVDCGVTSLLLPAHTQVWTSANHIYLFIISHCNSHAINTRSRLYVLLVFQVNSNLLYFLNLSHNEFCDRNFPSEKDRAAFPRKENRCLKQAVKK